MSYLKRITKLMRKHIVGTPELIEPLENVPWDNLKENTKRYSYYTDEVEKKLLHTLSRGVALYQIPEDKLFLVLDHNAKMVLYVMKYDTDPIFGHTFAVQRYVWASARLAKSEMQIKSQTVTAYVFFHLLMKIAGGIAITTDALQTPDGKRFWLRRVAQAFSNKQFVYIIDFDTNTKLTIKNDIEFEQKIQNMKTWIKHSKGQSRRIIISPKSITWSHFKE